MKKILFLIILIPHLVISQEQITYKVFYNDNLEKNGLKVELYYVNDIKSDTIKYHYSNQVWGERNLFNCLKILENENPSINFKIKPEENEIQVIGSKSKNIKLTYRVRQDYKDPSYKIFDRPKIRDNFFHVLGQSLFIIPKHFVEPAFDEKIDINIKWVDFPEYFKIHNSYASEIIDQKINTELREGLYNSIFIGGDYRIYKFEHNNQPVYLGVRGNWDYGFSDNFFASILRNAIQSQRDFWVDYSKKYFTVIITPTNSQNDSLYRGFSYKGSAVKNGFIVQGTNNPFNNKEQFKYLLYHELMHNWIGGKIKNKHEELNYWFSEGFTDYYTYKNRLRIGEISFKEWVKLFNQEIISPHWKNPERNISNYRIKDEFWKNRNIEKIPYKRGAIFAFWLDNQILLNSGFTKSLDDFMRELLKLCTQENIKFSDELFIDMVKDYLDKDISYFFQKHILDGRDIDLMNEKWVEGFLFKVENETPRLTIKNERPRYLL